MKPLSSLQAVVPALGIATRDAGGRSGQARRHSHISRGCPATATRLSQTVIAGLVPAIHASNRLLTSLERLGAAAEWARSEEHTSELQSLMRISYAVFCLKKKKKKTHKKENSSANN